MMVMKNFVYFLVVLAAFSCNIESGRAADLVGKRDFGTTLNETAGVLLKSADNIANITGTFIQKALDASNTLLKTVINTITKPFLAIFNTTITEFKDMVLGLLEGIVSSLKEAIGILNGYISSMTTVFSTIVSCILNVFSSGIQEMTSTAKEFTDKFLGQANAMSNALDLLSQCVEVKRHHHGLVHKISSGSNSGKKILIN